MAIKLKLLIILLLSPLALHAEWMPETSADYELIKEDILINVAADGTRLIDSEVEYRAINEKGRSKLVLQTIPYLPETTDIEIKEAKSITDGVETKVDLTKVQRRKAQGSESGLNSLMEAVIPFSNMRIGSSIRYKVTYTEKKVAFAGLFTMRFLTGLKFPERGGNAVIKSVKPIKWAIASGLGVLSAWDTKEGDLYVLHVKQNKPDFKVPLDTSPFYRKNDIARVDLSTGESWEKFAQEVSAKYEKILAVKELPEPFKAIAEKAKQQKSLNQKIDVAVSELAHIMTYAGDWTSQEQFYYPESLSTLAGKKTGDCKNFATIITAILRSLGIDANVAFVKRSGGVAKLVVDIDKPISDKIVLPEIFNHAIVHVKSGNDILWVDPTNIVADSSFVFDDLVGAPALVVDAKTQGITYLPAGKASNSRIQTTKNIKINLDDTIDTNGTILFSGEYSKAIVETALTKTEKDAQDLIVGLYGSITKGSRSFVEGVDFKNRKTSKIEARVRTLSEKLVHDGEKKEKRLIIPLTSRVSYYPQAKTERVTDFYIGPMVSEESRVKVEGYDFGSKTVGCVTRTPWYTVERKFIKVEGGFEVVDSFEAKTSVVEKDQANQDRYQYELSNLQHCAYSQDVEIVKLDSESTLAKRLAGYSLSEAKKLLDARGAESVSKASEAKQMLEQLLVADAKNKALRIQYYRALAYISYIRNDIDRTEYHAEAGKVIDSLFLEFPNDHEVLQMKAYYAVRTKNAEEMKKFFALAYYASPKSFDLYNLGGRVAEGLKQTKTAEGSYLKALSLTKDSEEQGGVYDRLASLAEDSKDFDKAVEYYGKAVERLPKDAWLFSHYLGMLNRLERWDQAIEVGEKMLQISDFGVGRHLLSHSYSGKALSKFRARAQQGGMMGDPEQDELAGICMKSLKYNQNESGCLRLIGFFALNTARVERKIDQAEKAYDYFERALKDEDLQDKSDITQLKNKAKNLLDSLKNSDQRMPASATVSPAGS